METMNGGMVMGGTELEYMLVRLLRTVWPKVRWF